MILVGTSGFQYRDWVTVFYPRNLHPDSWLKYYSRHFRCCEIGFTHFRIPEISAVQQIADETRGMVQFVLRLPARLSQEPVVDVDLARRFTSAIWPLKESGQLSGVLAQFPPGFEFIRDNFDRVCRLRDALEDVPLIAEFGCPSWNTLKAAKHFDSARVALACVDGGARLTEKTFYDATAGVAYVRFQGRNQSRWLKGDGSAQHDYLYSRTELAAVIPEIRRLEEKCERVLVFMNNPWKGQAVINARMLLEELGEITNYE
jgi:uncharacterized protein YecE (DUF72 family)